MKKKLVVLVAAVIVPLVLLAQERVDLAVVNKIRTEALQNSHVMDHAFYLTDVHGPLLAGSQSYRNAAGWVVKTLKEWGLEDAKLEKWGSFGRSWSYSRFSVHMLEPQTLPLLGVVQAWSPGTQGPVSGEVLLAPIRTLQDAEQYRGKLKDKIVMTEQPRELPLHLTPDARRYTDAELAELAKAPDPGSPGGPPMMQMMGPMAPGRRQPGPTPQFRMEDMRGMRNKLTQFLKDEGVLVVVQTGSRGDDGTIFTSSAGSRDLKDPVPPPTIALVSEHYNRLARLIQRKIPVRLEVDIKAQYEDPSDGFNVIANLPGGRKKDELVMIGAHLDSWHAGTGATDNAAGSAVMLEVMRILKALDLKMDRTVRLGLWDAEEQGLVGSRMYVTEHFADRETMVPGAEYGKLSCYFNYDNGSGKIRGVYLQNNDMVRPIFEAWLEPFKDLGATTVTIRNTSGTDHLSFDAVGLPAFQFIQDPLDYGTRTHHTNMDTYDRLQRGDLMESSAVIASFVYHAATRPEMLPRKPPPKPRPRSAPPKPEEKKS